MNWRETLGELRDFDPAALSFETVGGWPPWAKSTAVILLFGLVTGIGYPWFVAPARERLELAQRKEEELRRTYQNVAVQSATLASGHARRKALETRAAALLSLLPVDAEIPDLLDHITAAAAENGLVVRSLDLEPERPAGFYEELPMEVSVEGGYHEIAAFVSRVASLPRIVTLHDFDLEAGVAGGTQESVRMRMETRIYRRLDEEGGAR
ncbi:MAG: type 4a pilus biogenesis protein PilO [Gammaproteobacteria bacterium]|nr:type 4a pilus biogenesis protein PilO [Gammaproteobacteria bacterium]